MATVRDACDRCHTLKTRCVRLNHEHPMCQRCERHGITCNYSPPGQTGRPKGSCRRKPTSVNAAGDLAGEGESAESDGAQARETLDNIFAFGSTDYEYAAMEGSLDTGSSTILADGTPVSSWLDAEHLLAELGTSTYGEENTAETSHPSYISQYLASTNTEEDTWKHQLSQLLDIQAKIVEIAWSVEQWQGDKPIPIEDVFSISKSLIDLATSLCVDPQRQQDTVASSSMQTHYDQMTILQLSSCYLSLIDLFAAVIARLRHDTWTSGGLTEHTVSVGSIAVPMSREGAAEVHLHNCFRMLEWLVGTMKTFADGQNTSEGNEKGLVGLASRAVASLEQIQQRTLDVLKAVKFVVQ